MFRAYSAWIFVCVLLLVGCGGRLSGGEPQQDVTLPLPTELPVLPDGISAPPFPEGLAPVERSISDDSVLVLGRDWLEKSDNAEEIGSTLELNGEPMPWGIYGLGGFGQVQPGSVFASFWTEDDTAAHIYLGVADFNTNHWRFFDAGRDDAAFVFPQDGYYTSPTGNCYVAVLRVGSGKSKLYSLAFGRVGDTDLESPAGLAATADPGVVHLSWLPVEGAVGYNVYRAYDRKFTDQLKLNDDPFPGTALEDEFIVNGEMFYYRVTAVAAIESEYSNAVNVFVPSIDLPAPQNLRAIDVGDDYFVIAWDWEGAGPSGGWAVFLSNFSDFNLDPPTIKKNIPQGGARQYKFSGLDPGRLYFVRMAAQVSGQLGRMTEAVPCLTGEQWEWFDIEEIGDGKEPIAAVIADDQICASYMLDHVVHVALNSGQGQPWTVESTALDKSITYTNERTGEELSAGGFSTYLDIDYKSGTYLITSPTTQSLDFYAAIGAPGVGWNVELIDKGTKNGQFSVPAAGLYCSCAISKDGYSASGLDFEAGYFHYTRPFGKGQEWGKQYLRSVPKSWPIEWDFEIDDGHLFAGCFDFSARELYLWNDDHNGFAQVSDNPEGWSYGLLFNDLELVGGKWTLTAYDGYEKDLIMMQDNGGEFWDKTVITDSEDFKTGKGARMEPFRDGLVCVYMGGGIRDWYCSLLRGNGEWETQLMKIGEIDAYERADLKILNDQPVFIVADKITKKVYAIRGNIPPD